MYYNVLEHPKKYSVERNGIMEINHPLNDLVVDNNTKNIVGKAFGVYLGEFGTTISLRDIEDLKFYRLKDRFDKKVIMDITFNANKHRYKVPKECVERFTNYVFRNIGMPFSDLCKTHYQVRENTLRDYLKTHGDVEIQLLHNVLGDTNHEVYGVASPKYTHINTLTITMMTENILKESFGDLQVKYRFLRHRGFYGSIYETDKTNLKVVGDIRKFMHLKNQHSGKDAYTHTIGIERLECTNGATSGKDGSCRIIHLHDSSNRLNKYLVDSISHAMNGYDAFYRKLEDSPEVSYKYSDVQLFLSRLPRVPKSIEKYLWRCLRDKNNNDELSAYDLHYVLSDIATNQLTDKPQWLKYSEKYMDFAGKSIDPLVFEGIVKEVQDKQREDEEEDEFHIVDVEFNA